MTLLFGPMKPLCCSISPFSESADLAVIFVMRSLTDLLDEAALTCSACQQRITEPQLLPCLHSVCKADVRGLLNDHGVLTCPVCQRSFPAEAAQFDRLLRLVTEALLDALHR